MNKKFLRRLVAIAAAIIMTTVGISGTANAATKTLTIGDVADPAPAFYDGVHYADGQALFFEALFDQLLIRTSAAKMTVAPGLATSYTQSADKLTLTLEIRSGVTFTDGTTLTAQVVKDNLDRRSDTGLPAYSKFGKGGTQEIESVTVSGNSVVIKFKVAQANAPYYFTGASGFIISGPAANDSTKTKSAVYGSGPYTLDVAKTIKGNTYRLVKNTKHWRASKYPFDVINYKVFASAQAQANASAAGQLDITVQPATTTVGLLKSRNVGLLQKAGSTVFMIWWDKMGKNTAFTKDKNARLAFMYATDRAALTKGIFAGDRPTASLVGKTGLGYSETLDAKYTYNLAKAKQMLAAAGTPTVSFNQNVNPNDTAVWQALKSQWAKAGITVNLDINPDTAKGFASTRTGTMGIFTFDTSNIIGWTNLMLNSFPNYQGATNAKISAALSDLMKDPTNATKAEVLNKAIVEEAWVLPLRETYSYTGYKKATVKPLKIGANGDVWPLLSEIAPK